MSTKHETSQSKVQQLKKRAGKIQSSINNSFAGVQIAMLSERHFEAIKQKVLDEYAVLDEINEEIRKEGNEQDIPN